MRQVLTTLLVFLAITNPSLGGAFDYTRQFMRQSPEELFASALAAETERRTAAAAFWKAAAFWTLAAGVAGGAGFVFFKSRRVGSKAGRGSSSDDWWHEHVAKVRDEEAASAAAAGAPKASLTHKDFVRPQLPEVTDALRQTAALSSDDFPIAFANGELLAELSGDEVLRLAHEGYPAAQFQLARSYFIGEGVPQDYLLAHMWANLAASRGIAAAVTLRKSASDRMSVDQIASAQVMARDWTPSNRMRATLWPLIARAKALGAGTPREAFEITIGRSSSEDEWRRHMQNWELLWPDVKSG